MKIGIIGTGYVGLVTAAGLAELGHQVTGTDKLGDKIERISSGAIPIYEPGLDEILSANVKRNRLVFSPDLDRTIRDADVIFVCVGTPQHPDGSADMSQIEEVSRLIARNLNGYKVVVEKSTVPVKTSFWIKRTISLYKQADIEFDIASNPEFLREGSAVADFLNPDRIIVGVETDRARDILCGIYERFQGRVVVTNIDTAELIKHASNSFLALKISYINLISNICEKTDANVEQVAQGMGLDQRIGGRFLKAGIGYGGLLLSQGHQSAGEHRRGAGRRHGPAQGSRSDQPRPGARLHRQDQAGALDPQRQGDRRPGAGLQAGDG